MTLQFVTRLTLQWLDANPTADWCVIASHFARSYGLDVDSVCKAVAAELEERKG